MVRSPMILSRHTPALALLLMACGATETSEGCLFTELVHISSRATVIGVGDTLTFQASLAMTDCLPGGLEPEDWRWSSSDSTVVRIDSLTGLAHGESPGPAAILVQHARNAGVQTTAPLDVVAGATE